MEQLSTKQILKTLLMIHLVLAGLGRVSLTDRFGFNLYIFAIITWAVTENHRTGLHAVALVLLGISFVMEIILTAIFAEEIFHSGATTERLDLVLALFNTVIKPITFGLMVLHGSGLPRAEEQNFTTHQAFSASPARGSSGLYKGTLSPAPAVFVSGKTSKASILGRFKSKLSGKEPPTTDSAPAFGAFPSDAGSDAMDRYAALKTKQGSAPSEPAPQSAATKSKAPSTPEPTATASEQDDVDENTDDDEGGYGFADSQVAAPDDVDASEIEPSSPQPDIPSDDEPFDAEEAARKKKDQKKADRAFRKAEKLKAKQEAERKEKEALEADKTRAEVQRFFAEEKALKAAEKDRVRKEEEDAIVATAQALKAKEDKQKEEAEAEAAKLAAEKAATGLSGLPRTKSMEKLSNLMGKVGGFTGLSRSKSTEKLSSWGSGLSRSKSIEKLSSVVRGRSQGRSDSASARSCSTDAQRTPTDSKLKRWGLTCAHTPHPLLTCAHTPHPLANHFAH